MLMWHVIEPSNMLDVPSITFLSDYLQGYPSTVLVVSHDRAFLNEVATGMAHLSLVSLHITRLGISYCIGTYD